MPSPRGTTRMNRLSALGRHLLLRTPSPAAAADAADRLAPAKAKVEPIPGCTLGARVTGVSLGGGGGGSSCDLDDPAVLGLVKAALLEHALLVFPGQVGLTKEDQQGFARRFGEFDHQLQFTNVRKDGSFAALEAVKTQLVTQAWHTDMTFTPVMVKLGTLYAEQVPEIGGETEYADMRAGYDALPEATKARIEPLSAYHSFQYALARRTGAFPDASESPYRRGTGVAAESPYHGQAYLRPLVKVHPETGRKALLASMQCFAIPGLSREESTTLLDELVDFACQPPRTYKHAWKVGDFILWDERCVLHRARPFDAAQQGRRMYGTRVKGDPATEGAVSPPESARLLEEELAYLKKNRVWEKHKGGR